MKVVIELENLLKQGIYPNQKSINNAMMIGNIYNIKN